MKAKQLLPSVSNPLGVLGAMQGGKSAGRAILDAITGRPEGEKKDGAAPAGAGQQPKPGLRGLIDALRKPK
jgi:hypothetical protein